MSNCVPNIQQFDTRSQYLSGNCYIIDQCCLKYNAIVAIQVSVSAASFDKALNPELCLFFLADSPYSETRLISMCVQFLPVELLPFSKFDE